MIVIVCLDDRGGMTFNFRRQSRDSVLCDRILNNTMDKRLYMNEYSYKLFSEKIQCHVVCNDDFLSVAGEGDYCFVENVDITPYEKKIEKIIVYRWNKVYPADVFFPIRLSDWRLEGSEQIGGSSHDITEEIYIK